MTNTDDLEVAPIGRGKIRPLLQGMAARMAALKAGEPGAQAALESTWASFVAALDVGDAPRVRACPVCGRAGMADAVRCSGCWSHLTPPARLGA